MDVQDSYAVGGDVPKLLDITIGQALDNAHKQYPNHLALIIPHQNIRWTYDELWKNCSNIALGLHALGLVKGDRIGIWSPSRVEWPLIQYAAAQLGLILVNINPAYRASELEYALVKSGCRALVMADSFKTSIYPDILREVAPEIDQCVAGKLRSKALPNLEIAILMGNASLSGFIGFSDLAPLGEKAPDFDLSVIAQTLNPRDPINIQFTSGTTGEPKAPTLSHLGLLNDAAIIGMQTGVTELDRICDPLPLFHVFGMMAGNLTAMLAGAAVVYPGEAFAPEDVLATVKSEKCTSLYGVPTMFIGIMAHSNFSATDLSSLRTGIVAGAPAPAELVRRIIIDMNMQSVVNGYGMTETTGASMMTNPNDDFDLQVETIGRALPHIEIKLIDRKGKSVATGTSGEICVRGLSTMLRYWEDPELTSETIDTDGWLHSGDLAVMDKNGYCRISGRTKEMIIRGGENISPIEIEAILHRHPGIESAHIVGVPDDKFGEELFAFVKVAENAKITAQDVLDFCKDKIAHYKIPQYVHFTETFPLTASGKVQKFLLVKEAENLLG